MHSKVSGSDVCPLKLSDRIPNCFANAGSSCCHEAAQQPEQQPWQWGEELWTATQLHGPGPGCPGDPEGLAAPSSPAHSRASRHERRQHGTPQAASHSHPQHLPGPSHHPENVRVSLAGPTPPAKDAGVLGMDAEGRVCIMAPCATKYTLSVQALAFSQIKARQRTSYVLTIAALLQATRFCSRSAARLNGWPQRVPGHATGSPLAD